MTSILVRALKTLVNPEVPDEVDFDRPDEKDIAIADAQQEMWQSTAEAIDSSCRLKSNLELFVRELQETKQ
jgi:hypothetical protein